MDDVEAQRPGVAFDELRRVRTTESARPRRGHTRAVVSAIALVGYAVVIVLATLTPTPLDRGFRPTISQLLSVLHRHGLPEWFGYTDLEFSANVLMFVPVGFLIAMLLPARGIWIALVICPAVSIAIELTQATLLESRFATVGDVVANTLGGVAGTAVAAAVRAVVRHRDRSIIAVALWENGVR
jgi:glycopeptide antibiotics resistance protein